ncbi:MAG: tRNA (adenosine(37)-N6)-dimethylallyltransferase MiaA [Clostridia bacterium]
MKPLLIIAGATAVGKSSLALELAKTLNSDIVSADSMQIYRGLDIGTAKPSKEEQRAVKHHLIDIVNPDETFNSFLYKEKVEELFKSNAYGEVPLFVGGTGFYYDCLLRSLDFKFDESSSQIREELLEYYNNFGKDALFAKLEEVDPESAKLIHKNNIVRVIRAIEIASSGVRLSSRTRNKNTNYPYIMFTLDMDRAKLYDRINSRVDNMIANGLVEEVESIYNYYNRNKELQALQAIGYKEIIEYIEGAISKKDTIELIKQRTRNYAKRQITFFKRFDNVITLDANLDITILIDKIYSYYNSII